MRLHVGAVVDPDMGWVSLQADTTVEGARAQIADALCDVLASQPPLQAGRVFLDSHPRPNRRVPAQVAAWLDAYRREQNIPWYDIDQAWLPSSMDAEPADEPLTAAAQTLGDATPAGAEATEPTAPAVTVAAVFFSYGLDSSPDLVAGRDRAVVEREIAERVHAMLDEVDRPEYGEFYAGHTHPADWRTPADVTGWLEAVDQARIGIWHEIDDITMPGLPSDAAALESPRSSTARTPPTCSPHRMWPGCGGWSSTRSWRASPKQRTTRTGRSWPSTAGRRWNGPSPCRAGSRRTSEDMTCLRSR
jgi:hypothetical protein